ncbi:MAG: hypothetical protein AVDCRST_MAG72-2435 [uncultured Nocardioidaceae bacterium]|uniref:Uncharacterized protein n=1 Tax=uncultured Nocardioidaceae bacterium TaxID=253824 RepID=A0A6J4MLL5_9ACTN|nr:MAG: hypothetical protein AVDCRST_MAG72-2435 [uncultured Nocardioidaceae bacterium]
MRVRVGIVLEILLAMLAIVLVAGGIVVYVAFPHRGEPVPHARWLGDALRKVVDVFPSSLESRERQRG